MEIKPIGSDINIGELIKIYDKKLTDQNSCIFTQLCEDTKLDEEFLFNELYAN